jgi:hypothetical protein
LEKTMIRLMSVAVMAFALTLASCSTGTTEAPKAVDTAKTGCKCGDKPQGSRPDCACKDKPKAEGTGCKSCEKSCDKAGTAACPATGSGETTTPATEKK